MSHARLCQKKKKPEIGVRVSSACTRGTLYPDCRPPTRPTFRPQLRHTARTHTPHLAPPPVPRALSVQHMRPSDRRFRPPPPSARACRPVGEKNIIYVRYAARGVPPTTFFARRARTAGEKRTRARARRERERDDGEIRGWTPAPTGGREVVGGPEPGR
ncbi:unnamed protein product [Aphis gossypii]|uniref:Uncharacterized protein n=1 Tax=Aphis gossypii TaxID=80765 RepID=A0A9P0JFM5_APHGO|nr:unnamed protein product [Aphis gossypii]